MELANGRWIIFVDVDDEFPTTYVESFASKTSEAADADIINAGFDVVYDKISRQHVNAPIFDSHSLSPNEAFVALQETGNTIGLVWCKMFSTQFLRDNHLTFNTSLTLCEDSVFCCQAFLKARRFINFEHCGYSYHRRLSYSALDRYHPCLMKSMRMVEELLSQMKLLAGQSKEQIEKDSLMKEYGWAIDEITGTFRRGSPHTFKTRFQLVKSWFNSDKFWISYSLQDRKSMSLINKLLHGLSGCRNAYLFTTVLSIMMTARKPMGVLGRKLQMYLATR